jgi:hypothetical protein
MKHDAIAVTIQGLNTKKGAEQSERGGEIIMKWAIHRTLYTREND